MAEMADLNSLLIFAKVVEVKGFSEAARRLNIPTIGRTSALRHQLPSPLGPMSCRCGSQRPSNNSFDCGSQWCVYVQMARNVSFWGLGVLLIPLIGITFEK